MSCWKHCARGLEVLGNRPTARPRSHAARGPAAREQQHLQCCRPWALAPGCPPCPSCPALPRRPAPTCLRLASSDARPLRSGPDRGNIIWMRRLRTCGQVGWGGVRWGLGVTAARPSGKQKESTCGERGWGERQRARRQRKEAEPVLYTAHAHSHHSGPQGLAWATTPHTGRRGIRTHACGQCDPFPQQALAGSTYGTGCASIHSGPSH